MKTKTIYSIVYDIASIYVGETYDLHQRKIGYKCDVTNPKSQRYNKDLYVFMREKGFENFSFDILEDNVPLSDVYEREAYWIDKLGTHKKGFNKAQYRSGVKGKKNFMYGRTGENNPNYGKKRPKHSELMKGKNNSNYRHDLSSAKCYYYRKVLKMPLPNLSKVFGCGMTTISKRVITFEEGRNKLRGHTYSAS